MKYNTLGKTGLSISRIAYGGIVSTMGDYSNYTFPGDGQQASDQYVQTALEAGINYFDVAPAYGDAQEMLGNSLRGSRDKIILACKTARRDYDGAAREYEESLRLLHTDHFDVYQLHALRNEGDVEAAFTTDGVMRLMEQLHKDGTHVGITAHSEGAALMALSLYDFETLLFPFNWQMNMAIGYGNRVLEDAHRKGLGVLSMKSMIERGFRDESERLRWPKSWCKPFDPVEQADILLAAIKYSRAMGVDTIIPAGDIEHFSFALEHEHEIWEDDMTDAEREMMEKHLEDVKDCLFMPEGDR